MPETVPVRRGREGSRWINERPTSEEVAEWFKNMPLHEGMAHEKYVGGLTLIPAKDKSGEIVGYADNGLPMIAERENQTYTPYMKVETRVAYFWDLVAAHAEDGWIGTIEPVAAVGQDALGLPPGFYRYSAAKPDKSTAVFVGFTARVRILRDAKWVETSSGERVLEGLPVVEGTGTKIVATATRWDADINALMKAETGAIGRALGFAGMLVLPGSGVATAEDMQESLEHRGTGGVDADQAKLPAATGPEAEPTQVDGDVALRQRAASIIRELEGDYPDDLEHFRSWAKGRGFGSLNELVSPALKGVVRKLEKTLDDAKTRAQVTQEMPAVNLS